MTLSPRSLAAALAVTGALLAAQPAVSAAAGTKRAAPRYAVSCADAGLVPTSANSARLAAATLCLINVHRARHGERALRNNTDLDRSAAAHSRDMVTADYFDHVSPTGQTPLERIAATRYVPRGAAYELGENIALGTFELATPASIVAGWMKSPDHRANILNAEFRDSGIGIVAQAPAQYADGEPGAVYTQHFGVVQAR